MGVEHGLLFNTMFFYEIWGAPLPCDVIVGESLLVTGSFPSGLSFDDDPPGDICVD